MISARILAMSIVSVVMSSSVISAQDFSKYREFHLGMRLAAVAQRAGIAPEPRVLHQRPELIQELMWMPPRALSSPQGDSVRMVLFSFYNDQLFRIVVNYNWDRTEGLTVEDMVEALSVAYGPATQPAPEISSSFLSRGYSDTDRIVAHWEDAQHSLNLVRPSYASTFGLVMLSKPLDALARAANIEAIRLDAQEAPRRAIERKQKQVDEDHARQETLRRANKATFRH
jgi:hypothetical protein